MAAKLFSGAMEHDPEVGFGDLHLLADLGIGPFLDRVELKDLGDPGRELAEGQFKIGPEFPQLEPPAPGLTFRGHSVQPKRGVVPAFLVVPDRSWVRANRALAAGAAQMVVNLVTEDAHQPGALGRLAGEPVARLEGGEEGVLDQVFSHAGVAHLAHGEIEQVVSVGSHPFVRGRASGQRIRRVIGEFFHRDRTICNRCATKTGALQTDEKPNKIEGFDRPATASRGSPWLRGHDSSRVPSRSRGLYDSRRRHSPSPWTKNFSVSAPGRT